MNCAICNKSITAASAVCEGCVAEPEDYQALKQTLLAALSDRDSWRGMYEIAARRDVEAITAERDEHKKAADTFQAALAKATQTLLNIATNYDHDEDAHKYGTPCRMCEAAKAVLNPTATDAVAEWDAMQDVCWQAERIDPSADEHGKLYAAIDALDTLRKGDTK
jgi:hypothetical protein